MVEPEKKTLKVFAEGKPSDEFTDALEDYNRLTIDCEACGRTHYATDEPQRYEPGEFEVLEANHANDPDRYDAHAATDIHYYYVFGKQVVYGCPCNYLAYIERALWVQKEEIMKYFHARAVKEHEASVQTLESAEEVEQLLAELEEQASTMLGHPSIGPSNRDESRALRK